MKKVMMAAVAAMALTACGGQKAETEAPAPKVLVLYYSQTHTTQQVAECIQKKLGADIEEIKVVNDYDPDFQKTLARCQEEKTNGTMPELQPLNVNVDDYDVIFLGYPIWYGTYANPIVSLLKNVSLSGKKVVAFATFGSGGINESVRDLQQAVPDMQLVASYGVRSALKNTIEEGVTRLLIENGFMEGEIEALPGYTEQQPVDEEATAIFNEAIGDYAMLAGTTPLTVGARTTSTGTDYEFECEQTNAEGATAHMQILVTKPNAADQKAYFTLVNR